MSLVPDKVRKAKKMVDGEKLDAFVDEGLAKRTPARRTEAVEKRNAEAPPGPLKKADSNLSSESSSRREPNRAATGKSSKPTGWQRNLAKAPSVAFSVRIPTPLLERMRDVVAVVDGETLTSLLVEGATDRVTALESSYEAQVGEPLPVRQEKIEL